MTFLLLVMLLFLLPCVAVSLLCHMRGKGHNAIRIAIYALLALALARPALRLPHRGGTVVVVADRSASVPAEDKSAQLALIGTVADHARAGDKIGVVSFATRPAIEHAPQHTPFAGFSAIHDPDSSDLHAAIITALSMIPPGDPGRVLVLSDGAYTGEDPLKAASRAAARGIAIDYRLQARRTAADLSIVSIDAPSALRPVEAMLATAWIDAPAPMDVAYVLRRGSAEIARGTRRLPRGVSPMSFRDVAAPESGVSGYELRIQAEEGADADPMPENNAAKFLVQSAGGKPLLCFTASPQSRLPDMLAKGGVRVVTLPPEQFDGSLGTLAGYSGVVIENVRADALGSASLAGIATWLESAGAGLLMTGGRNSYGLGGYYKSPLEDVLPVSMELRREHRKLSLCIAIVMDRSGSMTMPVAGGKTKMDMANLGAVEVVNMLSPMDEVAVIAVDSAPHVVMPRTPADRAQNDKGRILNIESMGGGIFVYEGLKSGFAEVAKSTAGVRHILLFADAADAEEPGDYKKLLANARGAGISVSTVGLGTKADVDAQLLEEIAALGGGTSYFSDNAHEIPRLFAQDTFAVARNTLVTNPVAPRFTQALLRLSDTLPPIASNFGGYNLCYLHPGATAVAISEDENAAPLLAMRSVGAGRTLAFTGEADGELSGPFAKWEHAAEFYAALARHVAGPGHDASSGFLVQQRKVPGGVEIVAYADMARDDVKAVEGLELNLLRHRPGGKPEAERTRLAWTSADALSAVVPLSGAETIMASVVHPGGTVETLPPVCLPHSAEYAAAGTGVDGGAVLEAIAESTGGAKMADPRRVWDLMPRRKRLVEIAPWLYIAAVLLFLLEVFERRTGFFAARTQRRAATMPADDVDVDDGRRREKAARRVKHAKPASSAPAPQADVPSPQNKTEQTAENPFEKAKRRAGTQNSGTGRDNIHKGGRNE